MKFLIPINEAENGGSVTYDVVETGSTSARTNKRKLRAYFKARGVLTSELKNVFKKMGFDKATLSG